MLKGSKVSPEVAAKISATMKGKPKSSEHKARIGLAHKGRPKSYLHCLHMSQAKKGKPQAKKRKQTLTPKFLRSLSKLHAGNRRLPPLTNQELYDLYWTKGLSASIIAQMYNVTGECVTNWMQKFGIERRNPHSREHLQAMLQIALSRKPTKPEIKLGQILDELFPNEWKYSGNGQVILGKHCPDFININHKKAVIEMFGDYWHRNDNPQIWIDDYKGYGFDCLVVWEKELKNKEYVVEKIKNWSTRLTKIDLGKPVP